MKAILQTLALIMSFTFFTACDNNTQPIANDNLDPQIIVDESPDAQAIAIDKITAYAKDGTPVPTLQDYLDAGVTGMTEANLDEMNEIVSNLTPDEVDTKEEIQEIINNIGTEGGILTKRVNYLNGACKVYVDKTGIDTNNNGVLENSEVTSTTAETFTNGTPISEAALRAKVNASPMEDVTSVNTCQVTNMSDLFQYKFTFNQDISSWNTGAVSIMYGMFFSAQAFDADIGSWDTGEVTRMDSMFSDASAFNADIGSWDTGEVINMGYMFRDAVIFKQNLNSWNVNNVSLYSDFSNNSNLANSDLPLLFQVQ